MPELLTIEESVKMVEGKKPGEEFEFYLSSVDFPCEVSILLLAAVIYGPLAEGRTINFTPGCSYCAQHHNNPLHHLVSGVKKL